MWCLLVASQSTNVLRGNQQACCAKVYWARSADEERGKLRRKAQVGRRAKRARDTVHHEPESGRCRLTASPLLPCCLAAVAAVTGQAEAIEEAKKKRIQVTGDESGTALAGEMLSTLVELEVTATGLLKADARPHCLMGDFLLAEFSRATEGFRLRKPRPST